MMIIILCRDVASRSSAGRALGRGRNAMGWDFETDAAYQAKLDWADAFVRDEVEPLDHLLGAIYDVKNPDYIRLVRPLQAKVKAQGLWACHLGPELGGPGYGQVKL